MGAADRRKELLRRGAMGSEVAREQNVPGAQVLRVPHGD
jgi:hypothetical protein